MKKSDFDIYLRTDRHHNHGMQLVLNIPGYQGSGDNHWQTCWEKDFPFIRRVEMPDWNRPELDKWLETLEYSIERSETPVFILTHSLGGVLLAHLKETYWQMIKGAFIVAPPDMQVTERSLPITGFSPVPMRPYSFPATVVASSNDPYCPIESAKEMAKAWNADFIEAGAVGHINAGTVGDWYAGRQIFLDKLNQD